MIGRRHHTPEQIVRKLRQAEVLLGQGRYMVIVCKALQELCRLHWWGLYSGWPRISLAAGCQERSAACSSCKSLRQSSINFGASSTASNISTESSSSRSRELNDSR